MKKILSIVFLLFSVFCKSQTTALSFTPIANDYLRPGAGANNWNDVYAVPIPAGGSTGVAAGDDRYVRFAWNQLESDNDSTYNWNPLDIRVQIAIQNNQRFSTGGGPMPICTSCSGSSVGGGTLTYPLSLHTELQAESPVGDAIGSDGYWYINSNSLSFMRRYKRIMNAQAAYIATATYVFGGKTYHYKDVLFEVDIRGHGNFGEWHNFPASTSGSYPFKDIAAANLDSMIAWNLEAYPNYPNVILIGAFDIVNPTSDIKTAVVDYALHARNNWGPVGWRRDNWGDATNYTSILEDNPGTGAGGFSYKTAIMTRYQTAPIVGEPLNGLGSYADVKVEVQKYGGSSFGNGNISNPGTGSVQADIQAASFAAGCRLQLKTTGGTITTTIPVNSTIQLTLPWSNIGSAPSYETWIANLIIKNSGGTVVKTQASNFKPKLFLPGSANFIDNISTTGLPAGNYTMYVKIVDSIGYRRPMMISNSGLQADTSYQITPFVISAGGGGGGTPPTVSAGADITITSPASSASPTATVTFHSPATAATPHWIQISGPNTATISNANVLNPTMSGLTQGNFVLQLTGTDNLGATASDQMQIIVNAAPLAPNAAAGNLTTIVNTTVNPSVSGSPKPPATLVLFNYTSVSGPVTPTITNPFTSTPQVSGLTTPGQYIFDWAVTDNNATPLTTHKRDTITVNAAPSGCNCIAGTGALDELNWALEAAHCWGRYFVWDSLPHCIKPTIALTSNYTVPIVLPINTVAFAYSGKSNNKGSGKMTYSFIQVSGPTAMVVSSVVSRATVSALQPGTSVFALTGIDDCGAKLTVYDTVVVKPAVVPAKYLFKVVHVPAENQYDLYYSDGSVTFLNILKTYLWMYETPNAANPKGIIFNITLTDGKTNTIYK